MSTDTLKDRYDAALSASKSAGAKFVCEVTLTDSTRTLQTIKDALEIALYRYGSEHNGTLWPVSPGMQGDIQDAYGNRIGFWGVTLK